MSFNDQIVGSARFEVLDGKDMIHIQSGVADRQSLLGGSVGVIDGGSGGNIGFPA